MVTVFGYGSGSRIFLCGQKLIFYCNQNYQKGDHPLISLNYWLFGYFGYGVRFDAVSYRRI